MWRGHAGVVVCVIYWRCLKGAVVRLMSLKASRLLWVNILDGSLFHMAIVRGKKLYLCEVDILSVFVWVVASCLAVSRLEVLVGVDV